MTPPPCRVFYRPLAPGRYCVIQYRRISVTIGYNLVVDRSPLYVVQWRPHTPEGMLLRSAPVQRKLKATGLLEPECSHLIHTLRLIASGIAECLVVCLAKRDDLVGFAELDSRESGVCCNHVDLLSW